MSQQPGTLEVNIKKWVLLDDQIKNVNDKVKELREQKNQLEAVILDYVEKNNLENATAKISGGKLRFVETKQTAPISLKFLEECLNECITDHSKVQYIMNYIKDKREIKYSRDIKRYFDKE
jgi:hypothetical protein